MVVEGEGGKEMSTHNLGDYLFSGGRWTVSVVLTGPI